jgi:hypothetical protein
MVFVVEEARDLRMYNHPPPPPPPIISVDEILPDGIDLKELLERLRLEQTSSDSNEAPVIQNHSLGRVVFNQWEWVNHPA